MSTAPQDDPFRIRSHRALYVSACWLREHLGQKGSIHVHCELCHDYNDALQRYEPEPRIWFSIAFFPAPWKGGDDIVRTEAGIFNSNDPQLVYDEFERLMNARYSPPVAVPAGLEAADGQAIAQETE